MISVTRLTEVALAHLIAARQDYLHGTEITSAQMLQHAGERVENPDVVNVVIRALIAKGVTQARQAVALDVTVRTIANFYAGTRAPTYLQLAKLWELGQ